MRRLVGESTSSTVVSKIAGDVEIAEVGAVDVVPNRSTEPAMIGVQAVPLPVTVAEPDMAVTVPAT